MTEKDKIELMRRFEPFGREIPKDQVMSVIARVPTTDRHKGHWIDMADFEQCSECRGTHLKEVDTYYGKAIWIKTDFCPNCGADMRGEDELILQGIELSLPKWIPVSERLPKINTPVMLCGKYNEVIGYRRNDSDWMALTGDGWETDIEHPEDFIAWMPLPEPYKGGEDK